MERRSPVRRLAITSIVAVATVLPLAPAGAQVGQTPGEEMALRRFHGAVNEYVSLHRRLEGTLPPLQVTEDARQICQAVEAMASAIRAARPAARIGDIFDAEIGTLIRTRIKDVVWEHGDLVTDVLADIDEEVPLDAPWPVVNGPFPWTRGSMMPPDILSVLPPVPEELQYRLVGRDLVLVDLHADLVIDILRRALTGPGIRASLIESRRLPAVGQDRGNDDTQYRDPYEVKGQEAHPCDPRRHENTGASCETPVHEHRHEQAPSTVVHPHHEHPEEHQE